MLPYLPIAAAAPAVGQGISGFLSAAGSAASLASSMQGLLGGKSQISNRDYQHNQNLLDSGNPREIKRQGAFLEGLAPSQGAAYNTIQDATYAQDTQRQTDRIQTMGDQLGMSPWEITGSPGSNPLPSPTGPAPQNNNAQYMGNLVQLKTAEMANKTQLAIAQQNNETALQQTAMQTDTAVKTTGMTNDASKWVADFAQTGPKAQVEALNTAADTILKGAQTATQAAQAGYLKGQTENLPTVKANLESQSALNRNNITVSQRASMLDAIRTLVTLIPEDTWTTGAYTRRERPGANNIIPILKGLANNSSSSDAITGLTDLQLSEAWKWAIGMSQVVKDGVQTAKAVKPKNKIGF